MLTILPNKKIFCLYCRIFIGEESEEELKNNYHTTCHKEFVEFNRENEANKENKKKSMSKEEFEKLRLEFIKNFKCSRPH